MLHVSISRLLALKLNPPPPLLYDFFRTFNWADNSCAAFGLTLANNRIGPLAAFVFHNCKRLLAERGEQGALFSFEGVDDHPAGIMFLHQLCTVGTAGEEYECANGCGS